jgi:hypothetical protein
LVCREWRLVAAAGGPNANGWLCGYVPGREDPNSSVPSGSFHVRDGVLQDRKDDASISMFDLGVMLGRFATWQDCRDSSGDRFLGRIRRPKNPHVSISTR